MSAKYQFYWRIIVALSQSARVVFIYRNDSKFVGPTLARQRGKSGDKIGSVFGGQHIEDKTIGCHFADCSFDCIFFDDFFYYFIKISLKFVHKSPLNEQALVMASQRTGDKPLSELMDICQSASMSWRITNGLTYFLWFISCVKPQKFCALAIKYNCHYVTLFWEKKTLQPEIAQADIWLTLSIFEPEPHTQWKPYPYTLMPKHLTNWTTTSSTHLPLNSGRHFVYDIFKHTFLNEICS